MNVAEPAAKPRQGCLGRFLTVAGRPRVPVSGSLFLVAKGAYTSIGQSKLDIWEAGLFLSYGF